MLTDEEFREVGRVVSEERKQLFPDVATNPTQKHLDWQEKRAGELIREMEARKVVNA